MLRGVSMGFFFGGFGCPVFGNRASQPSRIEEKIMEYAMVSYAQNFEDVMLMRALNGVQNGFYVDVGAWQPDLHSVTRAFYEAGWSGMNVEPNPEIIAQYVDKRPRDINIQAAVSHEQGLAEMFFVSDSGLSSIDANNMALYKNHGFDVTPEQVRVTTLAHLFEHYVPAQQEVHFLKVDVEGFEKNVVLGADWQRFRPWIVLLEATLPLMQVENHHEWEHLLLEADYSFVYADGLNRFYLANEHADLTPHFKYPPNVFDRFILAETVQAQAQVEALQNELAKFNLPQ
jgi:FkbM family methyltransferase